MTTSNARRTLTTDPESNAPITFRCELFLPNDTGKTQVGTRVPLQSRGFQQSEVSILVSSTFWTVLNVLQLFTTVFAKFAAMFSEPDGKWSQIYPER